MSCLCFILLTLPLLTLSGVTTSCKEWCAPFCLDSCNSTLTTPVCMGDFQCRCICPTSKAACKQDWCDETCAKKAGSRKFEAKCDNVQQTCKCQFEAQYGAEAKAAQAAASNSKLVEQTFVADQSLLSREFKCEAHWCESYCLKKSESRKFNSSCDENQSCHCKYDAPSGYLEGKLGVEKNVELTASSNKTAAVHAANVYNVTKAECTAKWCDDYCVIKSDGRKYEANCDSALSCTCKFAKQSLDVAEKSEAVNTDKNTGKFECTQKWCSEYCESKSNGRKFDADCDKSNQSCKCKYAWQPTSLKTLSSGGPK